MKKYIIPISITFVLSIYITSLIALTIVESKYKNKLNTCKGMNNTYLDEIQIREERMSKLEQDNMELRFNLDSCESYHE